MLVVETFRNEIATWDPRGSTENTDVFVADPPKYAAKDGRDWTESKLEHWIEFVNGNLKFWDCRGLHPTRLDPEYVEELAQKMKAALRARSL